MLKAHSWASSDPKQNGNLYLNPAVVNPKEHHLVQSSRKQPQNRRIPPPPWSAILKMVTLRVGEECVCRQNPNKCILGHLTKGAA